MRPLMLALWIALVVVPVQADFKTGLEAYRAGDYGAAMEAWKSLAEGGQAEAQYNVGLLYYHGHGVDQDREATVLWYRKAAEQGYRRAQYELAAMLDEAEGVEEDLIEAYAWFKIAGEDRYEDSRKRKRRVADRMDPFQIAEADLRVREWHRKRKGEKD
jgi:TPR repeat protein